MKSFSQKYYPYLDEYEQQYNDIWFFKTLSYLKLGGKLYIPDLDLFLYFVDNFLLWKLT